MCQPVGGGGGGGKHVVNRAMNLCPAFFVTGNHARNGMAHCVASKLRMLALESCFEVF